MGGAPNGDPSDFLERNPVWNRLERPVGLISTDGSGGVGIGEEPCLITGSKNAGGREGSICAIAGDEFSSPLGVA